MRQRVCDFVERAEQEGLPELLSALAGRDPEETVVADADLAAYAQEFATDNATPPADRDAAWLRNHIDWESAGEALVTDTFTYKGVKYHIV